MSTELADRQTDREPDRQTLADDSFKAQVLVIFNVETFQCCHFDFLESRKSNATAALHRVFNRLKEMEKNHMNKSNCKRKTK